MIADLEEEGGRNRLAGLGLSFVASLRPEEGGGSCSLANGDGSSIPVTPENVFTYVRRYAQLRMVKAHEQAMDVSGSFPRLYAMALFGVHDV